jgi:hypothetical protein
VILNKLQKNPEKARSLAMALVSIGMAVLAVAIAWPRTSFSASLSPDTNDFVRGFAYGLAITLEAAGVILSLRVVRARRS